MKYRRETKLIFATVKHHSTADVKMKPFNRFTIITLNQQVICNVCYNLEEIMRIILTHILSQNFTYC